MIQDIDNINVSIQDDNNVNVTVENDSINISEGTPTDIAEIMHNEQIRQENEAQRIANEEQRIANEEDREEYISDLKQRVLDGEFNGQDGQDGQDGFSPIANVSKSGDTATITITDKNGTTTASISDGTDGRDGVDGQDGTDGEDGYSPTVTMSKQGKITTLTITDKNGEHTTEIKDGQDGSGTGDMLKATYDTNDNGIVDNAEKVNNHTVETDVPANAVFTDTTYTAGTGIDITNNVISNTQTSAAWGNITGTLSNQTDLQNALNEKQDVMQYSTMPTATSSLANKIVQYVGTDNTTYRPFSFYICKETSIGSGVYEWIYSPVDELKNYQEKIDSSHKLYSDLVTDTGQTNKFINSSAQTFTGTKTFDTIQTNNEVINNNLTTYGNISINDEEDNSVFAFDGTTSGTPMFNRKLELSNGGTTTTPTSNNDIANKKYVDDNKFSGNYNDLSNKPTIPANTSDLNNDSGFIDNTVNDLTNYTLSTALATVATTGAYSDLSGTPNLSTVATSGSYTDLSNKPTIPTVNNATLTIQKNGSNVATFTANASSNVTANISVPDITGGTGYVKYSDGTMICYGSANGTATYSDFWGFVKRSQEGSSAIKVTMPQSFVNASYKVSITPCYGNTSLFINVDEDNNKTNNSFRVICFKAPNDSGNKYSFQYVAIGKWK